MSHPSNTALEERAKEVAEQWTGTYLEDAILNNLAKGNLDIVARLVKEAEEQEEWADYRHRLGINDVY